MFKRSIVNTDNELNDVLQQLDTIQIHATVIDKVIEKYKKIQHIEDEMARILSKKRKKKLQVEIDSLKNEISETGTDFGDLKKRERLLLSKAKLENLRNELQDLYYEDRDTISSLLVSKDVPEDVTGIIIKYVPDYSDFLDFTKFLTGKVFTEDIGGRNFECTAISEAETLNFVLSMSKTKSLSIYEYYDGIQVTIDNGSNRFVTPRARKYCATFDAYLYEDGAYELIFEELGKIIPLIKCLKSLSYNTRYSNNAADMSWLQNVKGLKRLEIPALADLDPSITNGLDILILTHPLEHEDWSPETDIITLGHMGYDVETSSYRQTRFEYSNIKKVIIYTNSILNDSNMQILKRRFPNSEIVFET